MFESFLNAALQALGSGLVIGATFGKIRLRNISSFVVVRIKVFHDLFGNARSASEFFRRRSTKMGRNGESAA
jgi:hypothetical protein